MKQYKKVDVVEAPQIIKQESICSLSTLSHTKENTSEAIYLQWDLGPDEAARLRKMREKPVEDEEWVKNL